MEQEELEEILKIELKPDDPQWMFIIRELIIKNPNLFKDEPPREIRESKSQNMLIASQQSLKK